MDRYDVESKPPKETGAIPSDVRKVRVAEAWGKAATVVEDRVRSTGIPADPVCWKDFPAVKDLLGMLYQLSFYNFDGTVKEDSYETQYIFYCKHFGPVFMKFMRSAVYGHLAAKNMTTGIKYPTSQFFMQV